jgi:hypothetical protein
MTPRKSLLDLAKPRCGATPLIMVAFATAFGWHWSQLESAPPPFHNLSFCESLMRVAVTPEIFGTHTQ